MAAAAEKAAALPCTLLPSARKGEELVACAISATGCWKGRRVVQRQLCSQLLEQRAPGWPCSSVSTTTIEIAMRQIDWRSQCGYGPIADSATLHRSAALCVILQSKGHQTYTRDDDSSFDG